MRALVDPPWSCEHVGFTGTRAGMTPEQRRTLRIVLNKFPDCWLHHGDCVGADAEAHAIATALKREIILHPPDVDDLRAWCKAPPGRIMIPRPYLVRNKHIVGNTHRLIAAPAEAVEQRRSGTWSTVRYARSRGKPIKIILPSGKVRNEGWEL